MYLKSVEIYGFKSFANKVRLDLNPGITAIVGPNGCGKSNVVDSIKWSIGEMSRRALRMPSMLDVIFAGTTKRQPLNMAEVTLTFDNQERKLNFDFNEVSVTRKIYRSEESEYFINKTPCRLKDIRDMFLDTGIGSDGYAIISQGEIEALLSSDALGRREFFEEVAGVSKYKSKREESLKKLEKVDADLAVLENSLQIIDEQIKKLDAEAKKAKLQQKYREELREAEISLIVKEISSHLAETDKKKAELSPLLEEINQINSAVTAQEAEYAALNIELTEKNEEEKNLLEKISSVKFSLSSLEHRIINGKNMIEEKLKQIEDINKQEEKNAQFEISMLPQIENLRLKLAELGSSNEKLALEYEEAKNQYMLLENSLKESEINSERYEKDTFSVMEQESKISSLLSALEASLSHYNGEESSLERDLKETLLKKEEISAQLSSEKEKNNSLIETISSQESLRSEKISAKENLLALKKEKEENNLRLTALSASLKSSLQASMSQAEKDVYWIGANVIISEKVPGVYGTLRQMIEFPKDKTPIIEDALGKFLDSLVADNEEAARKCAEKLKFIGKGRARFIILDKVPQSNPQLSFDSVLNIIKPHEKAANLLNYLLGGISYKEDSVSGPFWICGGAMEINQNENYWGQVDDLKKKIEECTLEIEKNSSDYALINSQIEETEKEINSLSENISSLKAQKAALENSISSREEDLSVYEKAAEKITAQKNENEARKKSALEKIETHKNELNNLKEKSEALKKSVQEVKNLKENLSKDLLSANEKVLNAKNAYEGYINAKKDLEDKISSLELSKARLESDKNSLSEKKKSLETEIESIKKQIEEFNEKVLEERNNLKEAEIAQNILAEKILELKNSMERLSHSIREHKQAINDLSEKKQAIELEINTFVTRAEDSEKKLENDWNVKYADVKEAYSQAEIDMERVLFLRKRIENMGPVNMTAPEEYDALVNRHNSMRSQIEDLNKAKSDLRSAIQRINETTRENFKKTFDKVQEYFKNIYSVLFNGGEANLILTDPDNLLETGVEIMAHPPGKKLINISQLSGGEKSLTALALLFSFFKVNPSPFCIMDEVDAALDEGNVERFARMIKEFSSDTQFIIITHNKRTMEIADVMYGVTMEELGVSKIISVDLKKAVDLTTSKQPAGAV
ncbi:MAG: AAA family ATPase [Elusimicrobiota bacterium]